MGLELLSTNKRVIALRCIYTRIKVVPRQSRPYIGCDFFIRGEFMRKFEKISFNQFKEDVCDDKTLYEKYNLPKRGTKHAAGYDFYALYDYTLKPGDTMKVPTGIKVCMEDDDVLLLIDRSSMGFKYNVRMCNQVGVIDSDYYNNRNNEGHMWIRIQNHGDKDYVVKKGDAMIQGMFVKYLKTDDDIESENDRNGGFGSTNKKEG